MIPKRYIIVGLAATPLTSLDKNVWQVGKSIARIMRL